MRIFREGDVGPLRDKRVAVIGYGNVGRSLALNLRDSGVSTIVGNMTGDEYHRRARSDGLDVRSIPEAAELGDVVVAALPDDVMPEVYKSEILPGLHSGKALALTSGYPVAFGLIPLPDDVDVILFAPKMVGAAIRDRYKGDRGYAAVLGVVADATGEALKTALALAAAAGVFKQGGFAVEATAEQEALADLLGEHLLKAPLLALLEAAATVMRRRGVPPELAALELYASGEFGELLSLVASAGIAEVLRLQSPVSAYGQLTRWRRYLKPLLEAGEEAAERVASGEFAREVVLERLAGYPALNAEWRRLRAGEAEAAFAALRRLRQGP